jgi:hypothetical protein
MTSEKLCFAKALAIPFPMPSVEAVISALFIGF